MKKLALLLLALLLCAAAHAETSITDCAMRLYGSDGWTVAAESSLAPNGAAILTRGYDTRLLLLAQTENDWTVTNDVPDFDAWFNVGNARYSLLMDTEELLMATIISDTENYSSVCRRTYRLTDGRWLLESEAFYTSNIAGPDAAPYVQEDTTCIQGDMLIRTHSTLDMNDNPIDTKAYAPLPNVLTLDERDLCLSGSQECTLSSNGLGYAVDECCDVSQEIMQRLFDRMAPAGYRFIHGNLLQANAMYFLAENMTDGSHYLLCLGCSDQDGLWQCTTSNALPESAVIGYENYTDAIMVSGTDCGYGLRYTADGRWSVSYLIGSDYAELTPCTVSYGGYLWFSPLAYGDGPWSNGIAGMDWSALPHSYDEALDMLDTTRWATPNNVNPQDRLHLREAPDKKSASLGKYYNGTPVHVIDMDDEWCKVRIGDQVGYMMTRYLAFGKEISRVEPALDVLLSRNVLTEILWDDGKSELLLPEDVNRLHVVGTKGDEWTLMWELDTDRFGRIRTEQLWPGNG